MGLELRDVGRKFDGKAAVKNVSFKARQGEDIGLRGTSGCGKSTLLRALRGLDGAYEGDIFINGPPAYGIGGTTGFIFQEPRLLPWKSMVDNVIFHGSRR